MLKRWQPKIRLRFLFLATFVLAALLPAALLAIWVINGTTERELDSTANKQIALARTFALSLDRYAADRLLIFDQYADAYVRNSANQPGLSLAAKSDFLYFVFLYPEGMVAIDSVNGNESRLTDQIKSTLMQNAEDQSSFLPVMLDGKQTPTIFVARRYPDGKVVAGALTTNAISEMSKTVSFGVHGHAVIVDQAGSVIGHPKTEWEATLKSLAGITPVQRSIAGETGSTLFFAPARDEDALAGFTRSTHAGWGVLMVRPVKEIYDLAWANTSAAFVVIGAGVLFAFAVALLMARVIVRPVERAAATARNLSQGKLSARFAPVPDIPLELAELGTTLNHLAERIDGWRKTAAETLSTVKAADQAKRDFLATLSHEVRTPLNAIIGFGELAQMQTGQPGQTERQHEYAANIVTAGRHLMRLIDEILDLAAIEAGHTCVESEALDLAVVVNEASVLLEPAAASHQVTVAVELPPELPAVIGDRLKLQQILLNLMGNAIKFTPKGGRICVSAAKSNCGGLRVSIADNGIGMTQEEIQTALTPFGRVRNKLAFNEPGTGLGLPLACRLIETMNGQFELRSEPHKGTEVAIILPVA